MALLALFFVLLAFAVWVLRLKQRRLLPALTLIERLHRNESDRIERFVADQCDLIGDDAQFWSESGRWRGLLRKRSNAKLLVQLCQHLVLSGEIERDDIRYLTSRSILISFYIACSLVEGVIRWFIRDLPHSCSRIATNLYWEMERRATTLFSGHADPQILDHLHQML
jgi:hypothetical protein